MVRTMENKKKNKRIDGFLILILFLFLLFICNPVRNGLKIEEENPCKEHFFQIDGEINEPGVYSFNSADRLADVVARAGGLHNPGLQRPDKELSYSESGKIIVIKKTGNRYDTIETEMSAYYKVTLGIPICLNKESVSGLIAVPGIGFALASGIVKERAEGGAFTELDELKKIPGVGDKLLEKIEPYIRL